MKMLLCSDIRLGAICAENLDVRLSHKWQSLRNEKFASLMDKAAQENAGYIALFGHVFGQERVSEAVIDSLFQVARESEHVQILLFTEDSEDKRINYRNDIPDNLHMICVEKEELYLDDRIAVRAGKKKIEMQLGGNDAITFTGDDSGAYCVSLPEGEKVLPCFEPLGFEDFESAKFGYSLIEWTEEKLIGYEEKTDRIFTYITLEIKLDPTDDQKEIQRKIAKIMSRLERETFLRLDIKGKSAFAVMLSADALKTQLQNKVFYAEVYDDTVMDVDEAAFENDISLRSEFVRLALRDESLSETERNRLICCGWNVLRGREASE